MADCTYTTSIGGWATSALIIHLINCTFGAIGSGLSLYCLVTCKKVQEGMKIHLCLLFSMSLVTCCIALPGNALAEHGDLLHWLRDETAIRVFVIWYTIFSSLDRNVHAVLAVYRMVAVVFPFKYKAISRKTVSIVLEVTVCVSVTTLWIIAFVSDELICDTDTSSSKPAYVLFYILFLSPLIITVIAYIVMIFSMASKKRNIAEFVTQIRGEKDQPTMSVTILIFINIVLDVPHIIIHLTKIRPAEISYIVIHVIYRLHFALDPFIFIGLNRRYRQMVLRKFFSLAQVVSVSDSRNACGEGTSGTI